jgi:hypothetical protein
MCHQVGHSEYSPVVSYILATSGWQFQPRDNITTESGRQAERTGHLHDIVLTKIGALKESRPNHHRLPSPIRIQNFRKAIRAVHHFWEFDRSNSVVYSGRNAIVDMPGVSLTIRAFTSDGISRFAAVS